MSSTRATHQQLAKRQAATCAPADELAVLRAYAGRLTAAGRALEARAVIRCVELMRAQRKKSDAGQ